MSKHSYIDPDLQSGLERLAQANGGFDVVTDLEGARRASEARDDALVTQLGVPEGIAQETLSITSRDGHIIDLRIYRPRMSVIHCPFFIGCMAVAMCWARRVRVMYLPCARRRTWNVCGVGRISAGTRNAYPGPLEDCYEGLAHLVGNAAALNLDADKIIIGGVSAGGGLCAGLGLLVRDRGAFSVLGQLLLYPMIDDRNVAATSDTLPTRWCGRGQPICSAGRAIWAIYTGAMTFRYTRHRHAQQICPACHQPIFRSETLIVLDENIAYAQKLTRSGIPTHFHVFPGAYHGFNAFAPEAPASVACNAEIFSLSPKCLVKPIKIRQVCAAHIRRGLRQIPRGPEVGDMGKERRIVFELRQNS